MASSIGQGAFSYAPLNAIPYFPKEPLNGSTAGIGGQSSEEHLRYPAEPTHHFKFMPGSKRFKRPSRWNVHEAQGTWGHAEYQKVNIVKQRNGVAGYLNQQVLKYMNISQMAARTNNSTDASRLPRGGNIMRIVGQMQGELDPLLNDEAFGGAARPGTGVNDNPPATATAATATAATATGDGPPPPGDRRGRYTIPNYDIQVDQLPMYSEIDPNAPPAYDGPPAYDSLPPRSGSDNHLASRRAEGIPGVKVDKTKLEAANNPAIQAPTNLYPQVDTTQPEQPDVFLDAQDTSSETDDK
jgi:hypothetical protein